MKVAIIVLLVFFNALSARAATFLTIQDAYAVLQSVLVEDSNVVREEGANLDCKEPPPPGGWVSFPLACRRFVGRLEVSTDAEFRNIITAFAIEQRGRVTRTSADDFEYFFDLKLGAMKLRPEEVEWQSDRSYQIGKKIRGLCNPETVSESPAVVCRAAFHGVVGSVIGGYVETYYGPGLTQIKLESANSQEGHSPFFHWRASLNEAK